MTSIYLKITLLEPAIFDAPAGEPNSAVSYPYIPGSVIRGLLIGAYLRKHGLKTLNAADAMAQRLFFNAETRYLNATITTGGRRTLPAPLSWQRLKDDKTQVYDTALAEDDSGGGAMKGLKQAFVVIEEDLSLTIQKISRTLNIHTQRPRRKQADPDARQRALLFRYDALTTGQTFAAVIRCADEAVVKELGSLLPEGWVTHIGRARSAGYGRVVLHDVREAEDSYETQFLDNGHLLIVTLLSEAILRDAHGQFAPTAAGLLTALSQYGIIVSDPAKQVKAIVDTTMTGGFNRTWNLPLAQTPALRMGSVLVIQPDHMPELTDLEALMWWGVGERRAEGFGQVAVNWQHEEAYRANEVDAKTQFTPVTATSAASELVGQMMQRVESYAQQRWIDRRITQDIYQSKDMSVSNAPPRTQIGRLRRLIAAELRKAAPQGEVLQAFLNEIKGKYAARKFEDARIQGQSLQRWLEGMISEAHQEHEANGEAGAPNTLRYVDAVLERIQKEAAS